MNILFYSRPFWPSIGGVESITRNLAESLVECGNEVVVVTETPSQAQDEFPFQVLRQPTAKQFISKVRWANVFVHQGVSLRAIWPLFFARRPWIVVHHIWLPDTEWWKDPASWLKRRAIRFASINVAVSNALAKQFNFPITVIPNCYDERIFQRQDENLGVRSKDLIFVGRLIREKGVAVILHALEQLKKLGISPSLTIAGAGPEKAVLCRAVKDFNLSNQVEFAGIRQGHELAELLSKHRVLVVPSLWAEPFGIVALEGIACGCVPVGSDRGGLPEAMGTCGLTFPSGDAAALADKIRLVLKDEILCAKLKQAASNHLLRHYRKEIAIQYSRVFEQVIIQFK
mgnify:CR=1 FL=1